MISTRKQSIIATALGGALVFMSLVTPALADGSIKLPDREPSRLAAGGNGLGRRTF
jgi:hypothetical protein